MIDVSDLRRRLSTANSKIDHLKAQLKSFRVALDRSTAVTGDSEMRFEQLRQEIFSIEEMVSGKRSSRGFGSSPATISSRLSMVELGRVNTWGLTDTQKQQMAYVEVALEQLEPKVDNLFNNDFPAFKKTLLEAGAPWIPDGLTDTASDEPEEMDWIVFDYINILVKE